MARAPEQRASGLWVEPKAFEEWLTEAVGAHAKTGGRKFEESVTESIGLGDALRDLLYSPVRARALEELTRLDERIIETERRHDSDADCGRRVRAAASEGGRARATAVAQRDGRKELADAFEAVRQAHPDWSDWRVAVAVGKRHDRSGKTVLRAYTKRRQVPPS